ncbi:hypothetical protein [Vibrio sp. TRT 29B02]|uniref:hypothetical protein n=1 Tax=Vibrio sp. TRT 29B02 TaxID=3418508 RepID=UPI003CE9C7B0
MSNLDTTLTTTQRLLVISFLVLTFVLPLVNQLAGIMVALFLIFLGGRLGNDWSERRGHTILPVYFKAIGAAGLYFYLLLIAALICFVSIYDDEVLTSALSVTGTSHDLTPLPTEMLEAGAITAGCIYLLFISTLVRITWNVSRGSRVTSGNYLDTIIATALSVHSVVGGFIKKRFRSEGAIS